MKYIVEAFSVLLVVVCNLFLCVSMLTANADVAAAKEFKADVVAEIENSDFNPLVIEACRQQAEQQGYQLEVVTSRYGTGGEGNLAQVKLSYEYRIPFLGVTQQRVTRGIAR